MGENVVSSLRLEINRKNKEIDELKITTQISHDHRTDEMHLEIEEYKNEIQSKETEQRQKQTMKSQLDSLSFKLKQNENEYNMKLNRLDTMYKQRIETIKRMNESQIKQSQDQMEALKQNQFVSS